MPLVTKIEQQKKRTGRYSVYIDGQYAFSLSDNDLVASKLFPSQELTADELSGLMRLSAESKARDRVYNYLSYRQRSEREIRNYLRKDKHDDEFINQTLERLRRQGLVSDEQFAASWVVDRASLKPRSRKRLEQELRQKGVAADVIEATLAGIGDEGEMTAIRQVASKKLALSKFQDQQKLISYLIGQGFDYYLVKRALEEDD
jgi:regulatory protein